MSCHHDSAVSRRVASDLEPDFELVVELSLALEPDPEFEAPLETDLEVGPD